MVLEARGLNKTFGRGRMSVHAVRDVSFQVDAGECLGLIGESGSGKSTIAHIVARLIKEDSGAVSFHGRRLTDVKGEEERRLTRKMQMVFQNPYSTFNPRQRLENGVAEGIRYYEKLTKKELRDRACYYLEQAGLPADYGKKYPWQVSGGECQRAAIARALISEPDFLICDEITSALDVSVQSQILNTLTELRKERALSILFISHDLALVSQFCERVLVLLQGEIIESGDVKKVLQDPACGHTRLMIQSAYSVDPVENMAKRTGQKP